MKGRDRITSARKTAVLQPIISVQDTAEDLYERGLNVFPVPRGHEVAAAGTQFDPLRDKPPYMNQPFFIERLHRCDEICEKKFKAKGRRCLPLEATFRQLFRNANLACMMGKTSGNAFALDCDSEEAFFTIGIELKKRRLPFWAWRSRRGGAYLMRLFEGEVKNKVAGVAPFQDVEIWGNRHYVILPPSVHPLDGLLYSWETADPTQYLSPGITLPSISLASVEWVGVELNVRDIYPAQTPELFGLPEWTVLLSEMNRQILATPHQEGSRNKNLCKALYDIAAHIRMGHINEESGLEVLYASAERCVPPYPLEHIDQMLKSALIKADLSPAKGNSGTDNQKREIWKKAEAFVEYYGWRERGRTAQTDRRVFQACVERCKKDGGHPFRASVREVAEIANVTKNTASKALRRLCGENGQMGDAAPLLKRAGSDRYSGATRFFFADLILEVARSSLVHYSPLVICSVPPTDAEKFALELEKDVFGRLGIVSWRVWTYLKSQPAFSKREIADATGLSPSSVRRVLNAKSGKLLSFGFVEFNHADGHWYGNEMEVEKLIFIGESMGEKVIGRAERRREEHKMERQKRLNRKLCLKRKNWAKRAQLKDRKANAAAHIEKTQFNDYRFLSISGDSKNDHAF